MIESIHHVAIVVDDMEHALSFYRDALGLEVKERRRVEKEGVEIVFLPTGDHEIELVRPLGDEGGIARFLKKRGPGIHHICLGVLDIEGAMARLRSAGAEMLSAEPQIGTDGTRYAFVHPQSAQGVLLELYETSESE